MTEEALRFLTSLNWITLSFLDRKIFVFIYNSTEDQSMGRRYQSDGLSERNQAFAHREDEDCSVVPLRLKSDGG